MKKLFVLSILLTGAAGFANSKNLYFKNCKEARSKGYSSIKKGEPGYRKALDRDNDGIACEKK